jgi:hypothetical protein
MGLAIQNPVADSLNISMCRSYTSSLSPPLLKPAPPSFYPAENLIQRCIKERYR